jgi:pimeloyl-ACP methyl ester carboxylesterase
MVARTLVYDSAMVMTRIARFDVNELAFSTGGSGDPMLFVHGFGSNKSSWKGVCRGIEGVASFYAIDLPGFGASPVPLNFHYTLDEFADVLTDFIIMKDLRKLSLVGTSLGASVVLIALLRNRIELAPRVQSLCLMDAIVYPRYFSYLLGIMQTSIAMAPLFGFHATDFLWPERRKVRTAMVETIRRIDGRRFQRYVSRLASIDLPALVIWGRDDDVVPLRSGKRLARDLPNARLVVIDGCGHAPHWERPLKVAAELKDFARATGGETPQRREGRP